MDFFTTERLSLSRSRLQALGIVSRLVSQALEGGYGSPQTLASLRSSGFSSASTRLSAHHFGRALRTGLSPLTDLGTRYHF
jgi:hypothetical protein